MLRPRLLLLALLVLAACRTGQDILPSVAPTTVPVPKETLREPIRLTLVGTNDIHGWVYPHRTKLADGTEVEEGGLATLAGYMAILRADNPGGTLLLDGGDMFQGTLVSNITEGSVVIDAMNHLGYAAAAVGNHEFDYGPLGPVVVAIEEGQDPFGTLKARMAQAKFPILAVNIYDGETGRRPDWLPNDGTALVTVKGVKVGILGLITPSTPQVTNPVNVASLRFGSLVPEAQSAAKRLRDRGADIVVAVAHAGGKCASLKDPRDISSCDPGQELFEMLQGIPPRTLDAVVAGHTHAPLGHFVNGTPVIETWGMGRAFGTIDLYLDPVLKRVIDDRTVVRPEIPICQKVDQVLGACDPKRLKELAAVKLVPATFMGKTVPRDEAMVELMAPTMARVEAEQNRKLGVKLPAPLGRSYESESPLGNALADTLRDMERADIVLLNSGGLRADLPAGELRYGDVYEVLPFDNTIATITITGEELRRLLLAAYGARKGVFQQSGLKIQLSRCPGQGRLKSFQLITGKPVVPTKQYKVVMPDFLARGGDGLGPVLSSLPRERIDFGMERSLSFRDAIVAYWQQQKRVELVAPKPGRLTFLDDGNSCNAGEKLDLHSSTDQDRINL
jgi:5'-nucleotidase